MTVATPVSVVEDKAADPENICLNCCGRLVWSKNYLTYFHYVDGMLCYECIRRCPDCGRPQHYTGIEHGWAHDALIDTWRCADPAKPAPRLDGCTCQPISGGTIHMRGCAWSMSA